jgi:hypothetical protein
MHQQDNMCDKDLVSILTCETERGFTPVLLASQAGCAILEQVLALFEYLQPLDARRAISYRTRKRHNVFHTAAARGSWPTVQLLVTYLRGLDTHVLYDLIWGRSIDGYLPLVSSKKYPNSAGGINDFFQMIRQEAVMVDMKDQGYVSQRHK